MKKFDELFKGIADPVTKFIGKNGSSILTGIGLTGMAMSIIFAINDTPKYEQLKEEVRSTYTEETSTGKRIVEETKIIFKSYWKTMIGYAGSSVCFLKVNKMLAKQSAETAAAIAAYKLSETYAKTLKEETKKLLPEKKVKELETAVATRQIENAPVQYDPNAQYPGYYTGDPLYFDPHTGQYFHTNPVKIQSVENYINSILNRGDCLYQNDLYDEFNSLISYGPKLIRTDLGERFGWHKDITGLLHIGIVPADPYVNERPCWVLDYHMVDLDGELEV